MTTFGPGGAWNVTEEGGQPDTSTPLLRHVCVLSCSKTTWRPTANAVSLRFSAGQSRSLSSSFFFHDLLHDLACVMLPPLDPSVKFSVHVPSGLVLSSTIYLAIGHCAGV